MEQIGRAPWIGIGLAGDRLYLNGAYSHNIILEIVSGFGIPIGIVLITSLLILSFRNIMLKSSPVSYTHLDVYKRQRKV